MTPEEIAKLKKDSRTLAKSLQWVLAILWVVVFTLLYTYWPAGFIGWLIVKVMPDDLKPWKD